MNAEVDQAWRVGQVAGVAMLAGWIAERVLDTGLPVRGSGPLAGLIGLCLGSWLWAWGGWDSGPMLGSVPIIPAFAGAFAVCAVLKLVSLGLASPRQ